MRDKLLMSDQKKKGVYYGDQMAKGGGDWIGSSPYDLEAAIQSLPPTSQSAVPPQASELAAPFAELRSLAETSRSEAEKQIVLVDLATLQQELEKGAAADDSLCARLLQRIAISVPAIGPKFQALSQEPPLAGRVGPGLAAVAAQLPGS
jgi:hypothetical protein